MKKDLIFYAVISILVALFLWQLLSKGALSNDINNLQKQSEKLERLNNQLQILSGIGALGSTHIHADVKVYINGKAVDFSQSKYQLTTSYLHFEEGIGDVIHLHATGLTMGHLFKAVGMDFDKNCLVVEGTSLCSNDRATLKFYVNTESNNEFEKYIIKDLDKILVSYGNENESEIQKQLSSITNLAAKYSAGRNS